MKALDANTFLLFFNFFFFFFLNIFNTFFFNRPSELQIKLFKYKMNTNQQKTLLTL